MSDRSASRASATSVTCLHCLHLAVVWSCFDHSSCPHWHFPANVRFSGMSIAAHAFPMRLYSRLCCAGMFSGVGPMNVLTASAAHSRMRSDAMLCAIHSFAGCVGVVSVSSHSMRAATCSAFSSSVFALLAFVLNASGVSDDFPCCLVPMLSCLVIVVSSSVMRSVIARSSVLSFLEHVQHMNPSLHGSEHAPQG